MDECKVIKAIYCTKERRGKGVVSDPIRIVNQIYNFDGTLLMEEDSQIKYSEWDLVSFLRYVSQTKPDLNLISVDEILTLINKWPQK